MSSYLTKADYSKPSVLVESSARQNPTATSPNDCTIPYAFSLGGIWALREANINWTNYNITPNNNSFSFFTVATTYNLTVPIGSYTQDTLLTAIATAMTTAGAGTYTASTAPSKITGSAAAYTLLFGTKPGITLGRNPSSTMASVAGFPNTDVASVTLVVTPTLNPQLNWMLALQFDLGGDKAVRMGNGQGATFTVPIPTTATGPFLYQPNQANQEVNLSVVSQAIITVKVYDSSGQPAYLPQNWQLHLELVRTGEATTTKLT